MGAVAWSVASLEPFKGRLAVIACLSLLDIGLAALAPWPMKLVVDHVLGDHPLPEALRTMAQPLAGSSAFGLLVLIVIAGLVIQICGEMVRMVSTQVQVDTGQRAVYDLRARVLSHLQALPLRHHLDSRTADAVYRIDADAYCISDLIIGGLFPLTVAALSLAVMFAILVQLDGSLAMLSLVVAPFLFFSLRYYSRRMVARAEQVKSLESRLVERAFEILTAVAAVKSFAREHDELDRFRSVGHETMQARLRLTWQESLFSLCVTTITLGGTALVLIVGGQHVLEGRLTVGSLLVVLAYLAAVYNPLSAIAHTTGSLQQAIVSVRRVREIFAIAPEPLDTPGALDASAIQGNVRVDHVSFSYTPDRQILHDISFEAAPGELVALVGLTGAGKTTLAHLIPRLFEPDAGHVFIDGIDASRYALRSLRQRIAMVPQQPVLFAGTVGDNIRYGRLDASASDVEAAARAAHIHDAIASLPLGYATPVGEAGATLSGGERQRLGLARALLKQAPILILDEPTSALDAVTEEAVFDALRALRTRCTVIVIAHRLSTIRDADRILVLHQGHIVAHGRHEELLTKSELYRRMCARLTVGRSLDGDGMDAAVIQASA